MRSHHTRYKAENRQAHGSTLFGSLVAKNSSLHIRVFDEYLVLFVGMETQTLISNSIFYLQSHELLHYKTA